MYPPFFALYMRAFKRRFADVGFLKFPALCNISDGFKRRRDLVADILRGRNSAPIRRIRRNSRLRATAPPNMGA